jgi:hypothetical protein
VSVRAKRPGRAALGTSVDNPKTDDVRTAGPDGETPEVVIREATLADVPALVEMGRHFITSSRYVDLITFDAGRLASAAVSLQSYGPTFLAEIDGRLAGMLIAAVAPNILTGEQWAEEVAWWVEEPDRGAAGGRLFRAFEAWAEQLGLPMRMVAPSGSTLGHFYARHGFEEVETTWIKRRR